MSKPMVMTLPAVLLLLDYWPLNRSTKWSRLFAEKIPLFALSAACLAVTWIAQRNAHTVGSLKQFPISFRLSNAIVSIGRYLAKTIWPARLAVFYPTPARLAAFARRHHRRVRLRDHRHRNRGNVQKNAHT